MKKNLFTRLLLVLVFVASAGAVIGYNMMQPAQKDSEVVVFEVQKGQTLVQVAKTLQVEQFVKSAWYARFVAKQEDLANLKAGRYALDKAWDVKHILKVLNDASQAIPDQVRVTLPEGFWAKDIAKRMAENTNVSADALLALWNDENYVQTLIDEYEFLSEAIFKDQVNVYLEGYLFPETYDFYSDTTPEAITKRLLDQTKLIYERHHALFEQSPLTVHDVFTLASVVQHEGKAAQDMALIAGVFYNRLAIDMPLQSSSTICYALYEFDSWLECESNPNIESPYNTYKYNGLPIGPILNPSEMALLATLQPATTDYLYFVADVYGDGAIHFAKTYPEHQANVNKYLKGRNQ